MSIKCNVFLIVLAHGSLFCDGNHYELSHKKGIYQLEQCLSGLGAATKKGFSDGILDFSYIEDSLEILENSTRQELETLNEITDSFLEEKNPDALNKTLEQVGNFIEMYRQGVYSETPACLRSIGDVPKLQTKEEWLKEEKINLEEKYRWKRKRPTGDLGAKRMAKFDVCYDRGYCVILGLVFLSDGTLAVSDSENYEIRVYNTSGKFLKGVSLFPLKPTYIAHLKDYTIIVRVKTLTQTSVIMKVNLMDGSSNVFIDLGSYNWYFAGQERLTVVGDNIVLSGSPTVFVFHVNGTQLRNYTSLWKRQLTHFYPTEEGGETVVFVGPGIKPEYQDRYIYTRMADKYLDKEICQTDNFHCASVDRNGNIYGVPSNEVNKIFKYDKNCQKVGLAAVNKRKTYEGLAVHKNVLATLSDGYHRRIYNNIVFVYQL